MQYCEEHTEICLYVVWEACPCPPKGEHVTGATEEPAPSAWLTYLFIPAPGPGIVWETGEISALLQDTAELRRGI